MATWGIEIMQLANDFCLNTAKAKEIVRNVENMSVPNNVNEVNDSTNDNGNIGGNANGSK